LIPIYSALGAAIARVISSLVFFVFSYRYVKHYFFSLIHITRSAIRPVIISAIMALAMIMVGNFGLFASFSAGAIVYLGLSWIIDIPSEDKAIIKRVIASRFKRSSYISK
jgi:O-antigen/teichoic acid export membrane protein